MTKSIKKPWGSYVVLSKSKDFLIKKIIVKPEGVLSYQSHNFRSEHWIIIEGKATVIINNRTFYKSENENIFIPKKSKHRVLNDCLLYTSPSPRDATLSRMPSSA